MSASPSVLVLGYGNPGRQDDGLGPAAAAAIERLGWPEVTTQDNYQLVIEDAVELAAHDIVWFVDATRTGDEACDIQRLTPAEDLDFSSHQVRPEVLLALAAHCCGRAPDAYLAGIRGYEFDFAEGISPRAAANLAQAVALLADRIGAIVGRRS